MGVNMTTFIAGSKEPVIPDVVPKKIISANGGASTFLNYIESGVPLTAVITPYLLFPEAGPYKNREGLRVQTLKQLADIKLDYLVVRPGLYLSCNEVLRSECLGEISFKSVECWDYADFFWLLFGVYGGKKILKEVWRERLLSSRKIKTFRKFATAKNFKISTGMMCLAMAVVNKKYSPPYYLVGVGDGGGGYSYSVDYEAVRSGHLTADLVMLKHIARSKLKDDIVITDPDLSDQFMQFKNESG